MLTFGTGLTPTFWQHYHSATAHKPQTNNITNTDDPELDTLIDQFEAGTSLEMRLQLSHKIQQILHDKANFIPSYKIPYVREAYWRWIKLPEGYGTRTSTEIADPFSMGTLWIDADTQKETRDAQSTGRGFPPVNIVDEKWRVD
jgi:microcin C transport system substrate-binding protein